MWVLKIIHLIWIKSYDREKPYIQKTLSEKYKNDRVRLSVAGIIFWFHIKKLTPRFSLSQIDVFRSLRRDYARLRNRRISWIVSKRGTSIFHKLNLKHLLNHTYSHNWKKKSMNVTNFTIFRLVSRFHAFFCEIVHIRAFHFLIVRVRVIFSSQLEFMMEK